MPPSSDARYVWFKGGLVVPVEPIVLLLTLEGKGFRLSRKGDDGLLVHPASQLSDEDRAALTRWKPHVLALLDYDAPPDVQ